MKAFLWKVGIAMLPGGLLLVPVWWLRSRLRRRWAGDATVERLIQAKGARVRFEGHDDALRLSTVSRRAQADEMRREAVRLESGPTSERRFRLVR